MNFHKLYRIALLAVVFSSAPAVAQTINLLSEHAYPFQ